MASVERSTDIVEERSETAFIYGFIGLALLALGGLLFFYNRTGGALLPLGIVLMVGGLGSAVYALYSALQIRKVQHFTFVCSYCQAKNKLAAPPEADFTCIECHRLVPVLNGTVLPVHRVNCGFCREANYYSDKTIALLCEHCNHEIPISRADGLEQRARFAVSDDTRTYELILTGYEHPTEELISCLQQMLALNRNHVKDMLTSLPVTLLTGIPKKKAELLAAQLAVHKAAADYRPLG